MSSQPVTPQAHQPAPLGAPASKLDPSLQKAQDEGRLSNDIRNLVLYELRAHGYQPNNADISTLVARIKELLLDSGGSASAYVTSYENRLKGYNEYEAKKAEDAHLAALKATQEAELAKTRPPSLPAQPPLEPGAPIPFVPSREAQAAEAKAAAPVGGGPFSLVPSGGTLPSATRGTPYLQTLHTNGGKAPFTYALTGSLPAGLALDSATGVISGNPSGAPGHTSCQVRVTDSSVPVQSAVGIFAIATL